VEYRFDERLHEVKMNIPARKNVYLFFKEAINNVAKYSGAKHTIVKMGLENGQFKMCVCDDGKGFDSDKYSAGNGLKNMRRRASLLKGQVSIESKVDGGTTVHFETDLKEIREEQIV
jgi:signal transduction histidine kinase